MPREVLFSLQPRRPQPRAPVQTQAQDCSAACGFTPSCEVALAEVAAPRFRADSSAESTESGEFMSAMPLCFASACFICSEAPGPKP